ncbi:preprotein translocase, Secy subunit [Thermococcus kodakarensis KOD1]|uniref:Protein translocase subunit SecY n=1 Tax=Thermococcus kodakarensis (strain ATCC BAA-918 / JCM 12380 / KOD1) TaxID=69014 RepID=Q5JJH1_THEKO|nr:preprotein translocase subunit SecY [Thermococcus kodakarensis]WCN27473.1 preprotein translocase subunit SecY [Thermococcus kodakarensis]WCN29763.1 preprotein translocase subunit SecY [Thermococcus kodakarensis]BAD85707.1 preprotein translocase, Secy subunit [Thermococcus kodakarensis KOD1]
MGVREVVYAIERWFPEVERPKRHVPLKEKFMWTGIALLLYFVLAEIPLYGIPQQVQDYFATLRFVLAGRSGSLLTLGIGPIVTASIIMQLLVGSEIVRLDLSNPEDRRFYQATQRVFAVFMSFFEAFIYVFAGAFGKVNTGIGAFQTVSIPNGPIYIGIGLALLIVLQLGLASTLLILLDELVSKWGIGSGISLFIAAGVSQTVIYRSLAPVQSNQYIDPLTGEPALIGAIPAFIQHILKGDISGAIYRGGTLPDIVKLIGTIVVFLVVVYLESMRVEIPLSYGRVTVRGRYPIRFMYVSNIPIILTMALYANIQLWARLLANYGHPILGQFDSAGNPVGGFVIYLYPPRDIFHVINDPVRALVYALMTIFWSLIFGFLWVELTGLDARSIARQLQNAGLQIPGFRRDPRILERVLQRYIPYVTFWGSFTIALVAVLADFLGALGTGTGILLTVGILYRFYEEIAREQATEMFPALRKFFAK